MGTTNEAYLLSVISLVDTYGFPRVLVSVYIQCIINKTQSIKQIITIIMLQMKVLK